MAIVINKWKRRQRAKQRIIDPDGELIGRFLAGDEGAFNRLVLSYQNRVYGLCYRMMGNQEEALEVSQEVFITVYKSLPGFRGDSRFSTWLYRVTVNHCKNRLKYLSRRKYYQSETLDEPREGSEGELRRQVADEGLDPLERLTQKEVQALVQEKMKELDEDQRTVLFLRDIEGLSYQEIADILGLQEGTVKSRIHRARLELKGKLEKEFKR